MSDVNFVPAFAPIKLACALTGLTRSYIFEKLASGELKAVKAGPKRTLVDMSVAMDHVRSLPAWAGRVA